MKTIIYGIKNEQFDKPSSCCADGQKSDNDIYKDMSIWVQNNLYALVEIGEVSCINVISLNYRNYLM